MLQGKVSSVNISDEKGTVKKPVREIFVNENGIVNDAHSGNWHRQVSILSSERIKEFAAQIGRDISFGEFAENISTEGLILKDVAILDRFKIDDVELEVTQIGKKCHGDSCAIFKEVGKCVMPHEGVFCRVIKGGKIKAGDKINYFQTTLNTAVITVSDRASSGVYEDKSGPAVKDMITDFFREKPWRLKVDTAIVPDDPEKLKKEILNAVKNSDIIITTGGTGIAPGDITPETVQPLLDKELPGIMDYIRIKYGAKIPNALISRSIAGTIRNSLIFTLPGSVKAAKEYTGEILKVLEHALFMLKGINTH